MAALGEHLETLIFLVEIATEEYINKKNKKGNTMFHFAAFSDKTDQGKIIKYLISTGKIKNIIQKGEKDRTVFHLASAWKDGRGALKCIIAGIEESNVNKEINAKDDGGHTPLYCAVITGNSEGVKFLFEQNGIEPNAADSTGTTSLILAAKKGNLEIVKLLVIKITKDAWKVREDEIEKKDHRGFDALQWAKKNKHKDVERYLTRVIENNYMPIEEYVTYSHH